MKKHVALRMLRSRKAALTDMGVTSLHLFGSTASDTAKPNSDVDLFLDYKPRSKFSLIDVCKIQRYLRAELGTAVDIFPRDCLKRHIRASAEAASIKVF